MKKNNLDCSEYGIVNAKTILNEALKNHYAIAHINANNLEWAKAAIEVAISTNSPIIIGFSLGAIKYIGGYKLCVDICKDIAFELNKEKKIPIVIHLDHGDYDACIKAIDAGFTSIMFDGSSLEFEKNLELTKKLIQLANENDVSVEAELGRIGANKSVGELAELKECKIMSETGINALAVGIGNIHGLYPLDWKGLNLDLLANIHHENKHMPLVLHGGTGISKEQILKSIEYGISKININTECQIAFQKEVRNYFEQKLDLNYDNKGYDPRKIIGVGIKGVKEVIEEKLKLLGSYGVSK